MLTAGRAVYVGARKPFALLALLLLEAPVATGTSSLRMCEETNSGRAAQAATQLHE